MVYTSNKEIVHAVNGVSFDLQRGEMIFQDPITALNPIMSEGDQIVEVLLLHNSYGKAETIQKAKEMLELVGIPGDRYVEYPISSPAA